MNKGFTAVELVVVIFIILLIMAMGTVSFYNSGSAKRLDTITDGLVFTIEQARSDTLAGKAGRSYGVRFDVGSYTLFTSTTYDSSSTTNKINILPSGWKLSTTTQNPAITSIYFRRLTGFPQATTTVQVSNTANPALKRDVVIGSQGNISVVKY